MNLRKMVWWLFAGVFAGLVPGVCAGSLVSSPDGTLVAEFSVNADGAPHYQVRKDGRLVLQESRLGLICDDADFSTDLTLVEESPLQPVADDYTIRTAKRSRNHYCANRRVFHLENEDGQSVDIEFQVSNDGVAFRYCFSEHSEKLRKIEEELSAFHFQPDTKAWLQPMSVAKTGWARTNPSYEEYYQQQIPVGTPSTLGEGWVFPALFCSGDRWLLVSESSISRGFCGSRLRHESPGGAYTIGYPDPRERLDDGSVNPVHTLPWSTPWRFIVIGDLKTVAESTLGIDLAKPAAFDLPERLPGKAAWSWPLLGDSKTTFEVQKEFIDYAADMNWRYCLVDALWDTQIGYDKMKALVDYAKTKDVDMLVWYNSNGRWNDAPQSPIHILDARETRLSEFARLKKMGIAGMKIDFFGGDGSSMMNYYIDLLEDAQEFGFLINFHGCTLPRGWQRTYPNLMTMESIKGLEFITFDQANADLEPTHAAMIPFTRNVFDPMDFTPVVLDKLPNGRVRRTTASFELALSVLFTSGIQHYAEIPAGMAKVPKYVKDFLKAVPSVWDDVCFIDGYPGKYVVMARRGEGRWYVTGINGENSPKELTLDLSSLGVATGTLIAEGDEAGFMCKQIRLADDGSVSVSLPPNGGFVIIF